ncbi:MAG: hypothetical protein HYX53_16835 [Chloroflexi bacterium]|nr:hypothetical protein [Chloroflexota bacterium]
MGDAVLYIPIFTTVLAGVFAAVVFRRYRRKERGVHLLWWAAGILLFGVGTFVEGFTALFGWNEGIFRAWYISGALLGGAPLAQGTAYLLLKRRTADRLAAVLVAVIVVAAVFVLLTPVDAAKADDNKLSGKVIEWAWVRAFSPFINTYAFVMLVGGAAYSARRFHRTAATHDRFVGNVLIAVGGLLPGIGGSFTRFGHTEVLYVTEFVGIVLIFAGYRFNVRARPAVRHEKTAAAAGAPQASQSA